MKFWLSEVFIRNFDHMLDKIGVRVVDLPVAMRAEESSPFSLLSFHDVRSVEIQIQLVGVGVCKGLHV